MDNSKGIYIVERGSDKKIIRVYHLEGERLFNLGGSGDLNGVEDIKISLYSSTKIPKDFLGMPDNLKHCLNSPFQLAGLRTILSQQKFTPLYEKLILINEEQSIFTAINDAPDAPDAPNAPTA